MKTASWPSADGQGDRGRLLPPLPATKLRFDLIYQRRRSLRVICGSSGTR